MVELARTNSKVNLEIHGELCWETSIFMLILFIQIWLWFSCLLCQPCGRGDILKIIGLKHISICFHSVNEYKLFHCFGLLSSCRDTVYPHRCPLKVFCSTWSGMPESGMPESGMPETWGETNQSSANFFSSPSDSKTNDLDNHYINYLENWKISFKIKDWEIMGKVISPCKVVLFHPASLLPAIKVIF